MEKEKSNHKQTRNFFSLVSFLVEPFSESKMIKSMSVIFATKQDLEKIGNTIMSKISEFAAAQSAFNDRIDTAVTGLQGDITFLTAEIQKLQASVGQLTPEDQASLDLIQARTEAMAVKLEALDAVTPAPAPVVPVVPVV